MEQTPEFNILPKKEREERERRLTPEQRKGLSKELIEFADELASRIDTLEAQLKITYNDELEEELESLKEQYDCLQINLDEVPDQGKEQIH